MLSVSAPKCPNNCSFWVSKYLDTSLFVFQIFCIGRLDVFFGWTCSPSRFKVSGKIWVLEAKKERRERRWLFHHGNVNVKLFWKFIRIMRNFPQIASRKIWISLSQMWHHYRVDINRCGVWTSCEQISNFFYIWQFQSFKWFLKPGWIFNFYCF